MPHYKVVLVRQSGERSTFDELFIPNVKALGELRDKIFKRMSFKKAKPQYAFFDTDEADAMRLDETMTLKQLKIKGGAQLFIKWAGGGASDADDLLVIEQANEPADISTMLAAEPTAGGSHSDDDGRATDAQAPAARAGPFKLGGAGGARAERPQKKTYIKKYHPAVAPAGHSEPSEVAAAVAAAAQPAIVAPAPLSSDELALLDQLSPEEAEALAHELAGVCPATASATKPKHGSHASPAAPAKSPAAPAKFDRKALQAAMERQALESTVGADYVPFHKAAGAPAPASRVTATATARPRTKSELAIDDALAQLTPEQAAALANELH